MEDNVFWIRLWSLVTAAFVCLFAALTVNSVVKLDKWEKAVANGADPMVVSCALYGQTDAEKVTCHTLAQNRK